MKWITRNSSSFFVKEIVIRIKYEKWIKNKKKGKDIKWTKTTKEIIKS